MFKLACDNCTLTSQGWTIEELGIEPYETTAADWDLNVMDPTDNQFGTCHFCGQASQCYEVDPTPFED